MQEIIFNNPPIVEALIDIRVELSPEVTLEAIARFHDKVKGEFPDKQSRMSWKSDFQLKPGTVPEVSTLSGGPDGHLFHPADKSKIVQARLDGFTFNKLRPYQKWELFRDEAKKLWGYYLEVAKPKQITRLAVRYINRIELPFPFSQLQEYILTVPQVAAGLPQGMSQFLMQIVIPNTVIGAQAVITETIEAPVVRNNIEVLPLILDIDVIRNIALSPADPKLWTIFEELRKFKNEIFLKSLTEKTKGLFQ